MCYLLKITELPDTSIADTSTEDFDCSQSEETNKNENEAEPESEPDSKSVSDQKDDGVPQDNVSEFSSFGLLYLVLCMLFLF